MLFKSDDSDWVVAQCRDFSYSYIEANQYWKRPLDCIVSKVAQVLNLSVLQY